MGEHLKSLKLATVSMALLLAFAATFLSRRDQVKVTLFEIEPKIVALELLSSSDISYAHGIPFSELPYSASNIYKVFKSQGELYALGELSVQANSPLEHLQTPMPGGGVIYFSLGHMSSDQQIAATLLTSPMPPCAPQLPPKPNEHAAKVFYLPVTVHKGGDSPSNIVGPPPHYLFSNREFVVKPDAHRPCSQPGRLWVAITSNIDSSRTSSVMVESRIDLESDVLLRSASSIGVLRDDPKHAYIETRARYETDQVQLPVVGGAVRVANALAYLAAIAVALQAWLSFLLRSLRDKYPAGDIWLIVEPIKSFRRAHRIERIVAGFEVLLFAGYLGVESPRSA